eukprot:GHRQ01037342.1.p2 GENE.GHRQ01037342.1~~GHRQ01037342.1.p2  ORF type:complete len:129 (+),score=11.46 GHRQ01037342.1:466-852(+)
MLQHAVSACHSLSLPRQRACSCSDTCLAIARLLGKPACSSARPTSSPALSALELALCVPLTKFGCSENPGPAPSVLPPAQRQRSAVCLASTSAAGCALSVFTVCSTALGGLEGQLSRTPALAPLAQNV